MRRAVTALLLGGLLGSAGCLGADEPEPRPIGGTARAVARTVTALERTARAGDWAGLCRDVLSRAARRRAGGRRCAARLGAGAGALTDPRIELLGIRVTAEAAQATVRASARGEPAGRTVLRLVPEAGTWRVDSLGG